MEKHAPWDWRRQSEMPKPNIIHDTRTISNNNNNDDDDEQTNEHNNLSKQINK